MKKVVVIEKTFLIRAGISSVVQDITGLMPGKSFSGDEPNLLTAIRKHKPDIVILNPRSLSEENRYLPGKLRNTEKAVLVALVSKDQREGLTGAFHDLLFWEEDKFELEQKLRKYAENKVNYQENKQLSQREITILKLIVKGLTHQQIADELFLSIHTVNTHRKNINKKLGIKTVSGLSVYAIMNRLVTMEELAKKNS